jgi:hypothetical protein
MTAAMETRAPGSHGPGDKAAVRLDRISSQVPQPASRGPSGQFAAWAMQPGSMTEGA